MDIKEWVDNNIKPNVTAIGNIEQVGSVENGVKTWDVGVFVTIDATGITNRATQSVYEFANGEFAYARTKVENFKEAETVVSPEKELIEYLDDLTKDPNSYTIHQPVDTTKGKAAVVTVEGLGTKIIAKDGDAYLVRNYSVL